MSAIDRCWLYRDLDFFRQNYIFSAYTYDVSTSCHPHLPNFPGVEILWKRRVSAEFWAGFLHKEVRRKFGILHSIRLSSFSCRFKPISLSPIWRAMLNFYYHNQCNVIDSTKKYFCCGKNGCWLLRDFFKGMFNQYQKIMCAMERCLL